MASRFQGALPGPLPGPLPGLGVVVRQPFGLRLGRGDKPGLQDLGNLPMELLPCTDQQRLIGGLPGEGVLEGIDRGGEEACFVEELGRLQMRQALLHGGIWDLDDGVQHGQRHLVAAGVVSRAHYSTKAEPGEHVDADQKG